MKIVDAKYQIILPYPDWESARTTIYQTIETAGRTCYKSEAKITPDSAAKFVRNVVKNQHEAMLEHASLTVRFTVDRGVSHEIVRHRMASYAQESTRYCRYENEITVIRPDVPSDAEWLDSFLTNWTEAMEVSEQCYLNMLEAGVPPEWARSVLPNSLKTEIVVTMNMREWRHFFKLRAVGVTGKPHPQMSEVAVPLMHEMQKELPEIFGDLEESK